MSERKQFDSNFHGGSKIGAKAKLIRTAQHNNDTSESSGFEEGNCIANSKSDRGESCESKLSRFDPDLHGGEVMSVTPVGREKY